MPVVDADTHIDEPEEAWAYMQGADARFRPTTVTPANGAQAPGFDASANRWWLVDGRMRQRMIRDDELTGTTLESRELLDISARLSDMDRLGVDIHVIFPTIFLGYITANPEAEIALTKSWGQYVAQKCAESNGRLRWTAVLPLLDMDASIAQLRWAKENGACGVFKLGLQHGKRASDAYWFPLYEEAQALDMPICIHTGSGNVGDGRLGHGDGLGGVPVMDAFHALCYTRSPRSSPGCALGFSRQVRRGSRTWSTDSWPNKSAANGCAVSSSEPICFGRIACSLQLIRSKTSLISWSLVPKTA